MIKTLKEKVHFFKKSINNFFVNKIQKTFLVKIKEVNQHTSYSLIFSPDN